ncbi:MAG TPA: hypothetical protein VJK73_02205 [Candidatus Paceibacterota bacterium]
MVSKILASTVAFAALLVAVPVSAQTPPNASSFCTNIDATASQIQTRMGEVSAKITEFKATRNTTRSERWSGQEAKLSAARGNGDTKRAEGYVKLDAKATTDAQKAAVATFKNTVEVAVTTRKAAVDAAIAAYRTGVDAALATHTAALDSADAAFEASVNTALEQAKSDCAAGVDPATVRTTLTSSIKSARDTFQAARKENTLKGTRESLAATRKAAVDTAIANFKASVESAKTDLKAAFEVE